MTDRYFSGGVEGHPPEGMSREAIQSEIRSRLPEWATFYVQRFDDPPLRSCHDCGGPIDRDDDGRYPETCPHCGVRHDDLR